MKKRKIRAFRLDGDTLEIEFRYNENWNVWRGEFPYFGDEPHYAPAGRPWRNVIHEGCPYATSPGGNVGSGENTT